MVDPQRRAFLTGALASAGASFVGGSCGEDGLAARDGGAEGGAAVSTPTGHVDAHVHFYNPGRETPSGRPTPLMWPPPGQAPHSRPAMPPDYLALAAPLGISRVVVVESSSRPEDNAWALDLAERTPLIAGFLGNLSPVFGTPAFAAELARLALRPAFRGLRLGATEVNKALANETALDELRRVADADLAIDVNGATLARVAMLADRLRTLRIVVDHLGNARIRAPGAVDPTWATNVSTVAGASGNVFMKVSGLPEATGNGTGDAPTDPSHYAAAIDHVRNAFGDDRVLFATNWPVCERAAPLTGIHALASSYIAPRGPGVARRFFSGNAASAYKVAGSNGPGPR